MNIFNEIPRDPNTILDTTGIPRILLDVWPEVAVVSDVNATDRAVKFGHIAFEGNAFESTRQSRDPKFNERELQQIRAIRDSCGCSEEIAQDTVLAERLESGS